MASTTSMGPTTQSGILVTAFFRERRAGRPLVFFCPGKYTGAERERIKARVHETVGRHIGSPKVISVIFAGPIQGTEGALAIKPQEDGEIQFSPIN